MQSDGVLRAGSHEEIAPLKVMAEYARDFLRIMAGHRAYTEASMRKMLRTGPIQAVAKEYKRLIDNLMAQLPKEFSGIPDTTDSQRSTFGSAPRNLSASPSLVVFRWQNHWKHFPLLTNV